jgi:hypothetical protein
MPPARTFLPLSCFVLAGALAASPAAALGPVADPELPPPGPLQPSGFQSSPYRKPAMMQAGIAVTAVGAAMMLGGRAAFAASSAGGGGCAPGSDTCALNGALGDLLAILLGGVGFGHVVVGLPMIVVGSRPAADPTPLARVVLPVAPIGPSRTLGLTWTF